MFCTKCGNQLPEGSRFCTSCGAQIDVASVVEEMPVPVVEDTYSEPVDWAEETQAEETVAAEGAAFDYAVEETEVVEQQPAEKKHGKKRVVLMAVAAAVVVALLVGMIVLIAVAGSPEAKLAKAAQKSGKELEELLSNSDNFVAMIENAENLYKAQELTAKIDYTMDQSYEDFYSMSQGVSLQLSASQKDKELYVGGAIESSFDYPDYPEYGYDQSYEIVAYANEKELMAAMPDVVDDAYSLPLKNLGEKLFESDLGGLLEDELDDEALDALQTLDINLFADTSWESFKKAYPDEAKDFMDSLVVEKADEEIPNADEDLKVYCVTWDMEAFADMMVAYQLYTMEASFGEGIVDYLDDVEDELKDSFSEMEDYEFVVYAGVDKGCLTALHMQIDDGYDDYTLTIVLEGKDNLWEDIVIYADEEEVMTGGFEQTKDGFELVLEVDGDELVIVCDDAACELILSADGDEIVVEYGAENKGCQLCYEYMEDSNRVTLTVELLPMERIEKLSDPIDLLELSENELEDLAAEIGEELG